MATGQRRPPRQVTTKATPTKKIPRPADRRHARQRVKPLPAQPVGQPRRPPPRMQSAQLDQPHLGRGRHLMRARPRPMRPVGQALQPRPGIEAQPPVQRLPRHPTFAAASVTDNPSSITANTAKYRCTATLSSRTQTTSQHSRKAAKRSCQGSTEQASTITRAGVKDQPNRFRQASTELAHPRGGPRGARTHNPRIKSPIHGVSESAGIAGPCRFRWSASRQRVVFDRPNRARAKLPGSQRAPDLDPQVI